MKVIKAVERVVSAPPPNEVVLLHPDLVKPDLETLRQNVIDAAIIWTHTKAKGWLEWQKNARDLRNAIRMLEQAERS